MESGLKLLEPPLLGRPHGLPGADEIIFHPWVQEFHGMLCNNTRKYMTEEMIRNQFCNVNNYYIIGEINSRQSSYVTQ